MGESGSMATPTGSAATGLARDAGRSRATATAPTVAIAGGGPAGSVAALVLARRGLRVVVLEANPGPQQKVGETLPPSVRPLLRHLGLERSLAADGHLRSQGNRSLWGSPRPAESPFLANPHGEGWHLDRQRFEARLAAAAADAGVEWRWGCRVERCVRVDHRWRLDLSTLGGTSAAMDVDFVADATGRRACIARRLGARRLRYDRLVGVCALLESPGPAADAYTLVEAVKDGWWYSALLADGRLAVCRFGDGDLLDRALLQGDRSIWWRQLARTAATRERVEGCAHGDHEARTPLWIQPAESSRLDAIAGDRWLALGDAAAAYDPLSSHGVASAMGSGYYAGHAIADRLTGHPDAIPAYLAAMQRTYGAYLDLLRHHYRRERRWTDAPFWHRRQAMRFALEPLDLRAGADGKSLVGRNAA